MSTLNSPFLQLIQNLAPTSLQQSVWEALQDKHWYFGNQSNEGQAGVPFWKMDLDASAPVTQLWQHCKPFCEQKTGRALRVVRQYANGHTYGQGGQPHRDDMREGTYTLLYYPMPEWRGEWEGETMFLGDNHEVIAAVRPQPNRAVLFDSRILHYGKAPARSYSGLRITVAFKLEPAQ
ncbi:MAG TPA: 2OG-Fe(II) oxygenase [Candidatus Acidoferrum sp.]|nr:2OG-Fe(II) oxygenase [Candidatus Acidoferrum sp.]